MYDIKESSEEHLTKIFGDEQDTGQISKKGW